MAFVCFLARDDKRFESDTRRILLPKVYLLSKTIFSNFRFA